MSKQRQRRTNKEKAQAGDYYGGPDRYYDQVNEVTVVKLYSGDFYATEIAGEMIMTILGSCVAACIRDPYVQVGGMNHFLLPGDVNMDLRQNDTATRYGAFAMEKLINEVLKLGGRRERLEVKLFGGGNVINNSALIGEKNVNFVREYVKMEGLNVVAEDLGGTSPRRLHYYPDSGKVMMRALHRKDDLRIVEEESAYEQKITKEQSSESDSGSSVELF